MTCYILDRKTHVRDRELNILSDGMRDLLHAFEFACASLTDIQFKVKWCKRIITFENF